MCGAFEQHLEAMHRWAELMRDWPPDAECRRNIRPTDLAGTLDAEGYRVRKWSLVPKWAKEPKLKFATFNARAETVAEKPAFRDAWRRSQRCVIPASAYFEWPVVGRKKQCHRLESPDGSPVLLAGLWETWSGGAGETVSTFTILTTDALSDIAWVHHRTPLLLDFDSLEHWLTCSPEEAGTLLIPGASSGLTVAAVTSPKA